MSEALQNPAFESMDELLDASMNDLMDLPPIGVPPTGSYVFEVSAGREKAKEGDGEYEQAARFKNSLSFRKDIFIIVDMFYEVDRDGIVK